MDFKNKKVIYIVVIVIIILFLIVLLLNLKSDNSGEIINKTKNIDNNSVIQTDNTKTNKISNEYKDLLNDLFDKGPFYIDQVDCDSFKEQDAKDFCISEKKDIEKIKSEITWGKVFEKGNDYILNFDCNKIALDGGKQECKDYKQKIIEFNKK